MSGRAHDEDPWERSRPGADRAGADGSPGGDDVLEHGSRWPPSLPWRPPVTWRPRRVTAILAAAALLAGLAGGYAAGRYAAGRYASPHSAPPRRPSAAALTPFTAAGFPVAETGAKCSAQVGSDLQLGEQVTNTSAASLTLRQVTAVLPLGGLRVTAQAWGPCGELPEPGFTPSGVAIRPGRLPAGTSVWFTVTFRVLVKCPQPLPVQFTVEFEQDGRLATAHLPGFPDLGQVPYGRCA
jgi:hypothetical protein